MFSWFGKKKENNQGGKTAAAPGKAPSTEFNVPPSADNENQDEERWED